jgi:hypothetical protein
MGGGKGKIEGAGKVDGRGRGCRGKGEIDSIGRGRDGLTSTTRENEVAFIEAVDDTKGVHAWLRVEYTRTGW